MVDVKPLALLVGVLLVYFVGVGGVDALFAEGAEPAAALLSPLTNGSPIDIGLLALGFALVGAAAVHLQRGPLDRATLFRGVALGCGIVTALMVALVVAGGETLPVESAGAAVIAGVLQAAVGIVLGGLLLCRRETRRLGWAPAVVNVCCGAAAGVLFLGI